MMSEQGHAQPNAQKTPDLSETAAIRRFGGKRELYEKSLIKFANSLPSDWQSFEAAIRDADETKRYVHTIKGTAGNLSLPSVYNAAVTFEASLKAMAPDPALYADFTFACDDFRKKALSKANTQADNKSSTEGTKEEFDSCIFALKKALSDYDLTGCKKALGLLSSKTWPIPGESKKHLAELVRLTEDYEYDAAAEIITRFFNC